MVQKSKPKAKRMSKPDAVAAKRIAKRLSETEKKPLAQIRNIVEMCGAEFAEFMLEPAEQIYKDEGLMTQDGTRKRTLGGVYFYLVRGSLPTEIRVQIFPPKRQQQRKAEEARSGRYPALEWEKRKEQLAHIFDKEKGEVEEVNIVLRGRPGHLERRDGFVILTMEMNIDDNQTFPRGLPGVPREPSLFFVYVGEQQWEKNGGDAYEKDEEAAITVEGAPVYDAEMGGIAIFTRAIKVRSVLLKTKKGKESDAPAKAKDEAKAAKPPKEKKPKKQEPAASGPTPGPVAPPAAPKVAAPVPTPAPAEEPDNDMPDMSKYPADIAKKLRPLYGARRLFQKRLADIEALPQDKQSGLQAARMMLERTEQQIAALEKHGESNK